jgi:hypothetical protein
MFFKSERGATKTRRLEKYTGAGSFLSGILLSLSEHLKPIIGIEAVKMGLVPLGISDAPVTLDATPTVDLAVPSPI